MRAHDDQAFRELRDLVHRAPLHGARLAEDRVQRRHDRHAELAKQRQHVAPRLAPEDPVFVLHAHDVDPVDVQEVGGTAVRRDVVLGDLETDARRVRVPPAGVVHREHEAIQGGELGGDRVAEIGRERRDTAVARHVIAEHRDLADLSPRRGRERSDRIGVARERGPRIATPRDRRVHFGRNRDHANPTLSASDLGITSVPWSPSARTSVPDRMRCDGIRTRIPSTRHTKLTPVSNNTCTSENSKELSMATSYFWVGSE